MLDKKCVCSDKVVIIGAFYHFTIDDTCKHLTFEKKERKKETRKSRDAGTRRVCLHTGIFIVNIYFKDSELYTEKNKNE